VIARFCIARIRFRVAESGSVREHTLPNRHRTGVAGGERGSWRCFIHLGRQQGVGRRLRGQVSSAAARGRLQPLVGAGCLPAEGRPPPPEVIGRLDPTLNRGPGTTHGRPFTELLRTPGNLMLIDAAAYSLDKELKTFSSNSLQVELALSPVEAAQNIPAFLNQPSDSSDMTLK
jgi:hypothetical protein